MMNVGPGESNWASVGNPDGSLTVFTYNSAGTLANKESSFVVWTF